MEPVVTRAIRVHSRNAKFAGVAAAIAVVLGLVDLYLTLGLRSDLSAKRHILMSGLGVASGTFGLLAMLIAAPQVIFPIALLCAPFLVSIFAMAYEPWLRWWFWPGTGLCVIAAGYALLRLASSKEPNKAPEPTTTSVMPAAEQPSRRP